MNNERLGHGDHYGEMNFTLRVDDVYNPDKYNTPCEYVVAISKYLYVIPRSIHKDSVW